jgi:hypothetical protein
MTASVFISTSSVHVLHFFYRLNNTSYHIFSLVIVILAGVSDISLWLLLAIPWLWVMWNIFFINSFTICISSYKECLFKFFFHFKICLYIWFFWCCYWIIGFLILCTLISCHRCVKVFLPLQRCPFGVLFPFPVRVARNISPFSFHFSLLFPVILK